MGEKSADRERLSPLAAAFANPAGEFESGILNEFFTHLALQRPEPLGRVQKQVKNLPDWESDYKPYLRSETSEIWYPWIIRP